MQVGNGVTKMLLGGVLAIGTAGSMPAPAATEMAPDASLEALQGGGHVVLNRHAATVIDDADQVDAVMGDCSTERTPSASGWLGARRIGAGFTVHRIPVAKIISSEYCRAWQTADLAFGRYPEPTGVAFVLEPGGNGGFEALGQIPPGMWF